MIQVPKMPSLTFEQPTTYDPCPSPTFISQVEVEIQSNINVQTVVNNMSSSNQHIQVSTESISTTVDNNQVDDSHLSSPSLGGNGPDRHQSVC